MTLSSLEHVEVSAIQCTGEEWLREAGIALEEASCRPETRAFVLRIPTEIGNSSDALHALAVKIRASDFVVFALLDGAYSAEAMTVVAAVDLVVATQSTTFSLTTESPDAFDEGWIASLPVRMAKWLAFGAGAVDAITLTRFGAINFLVPAEELELRGAAIAEHVARIPEDVIALKKRAHDGRARMAYA